MGYGFRIFYTAYSETPTSDWTAVFKSNRKLAAQVTLVKTPKEDRTTPDENKIFTPEAAKLFAERSKDVVKFVALAVIGTYAAVKAIDTACEVIVKKTRSADNEK